MKKNGTIRAISALLLCVCVAGRAHGGGPLAFPSVEGASVGVRVVRLADGTALADYDSERLMVPASVMKCVTAATAQLTLPEDYAFATHLVVGGEVGGDGVVGGPVWVVGGYDPTLDSRFIGQEGSFVDWATERLSGCGIKRVGGIIALPDEDVGDAVSPYWLVEDLEWEYGAGCFALNYRDNSYSESDGRRADASPGASLCDALAERLERSAIAVDWDWEVEIADDSTAMGQLAECRRIWTHLSPRRDEILRTMMHRSDNLYAEAMLRAPLLNDPQWQAVDSGWRMAAVVPVDSALAVERRLWSARGVELARGRVVDGSGLSPVNRLSARMLSDLLCSMAREEKYVALFPIAGRDGTVKSFLRRTRLDGRMALKSGSMTGVLCYAGYLLGRNGAPTHAVVVMVNGFTCPAAKVKEAISTYLNALLR